MSRTHIARAKSLLGFSSLLCRLRRFRPFHRFEAATANASLELAGNAGDLASCRLPNDDPLGTFAGHHAATLRRKREVLAPNPAAPGIPVLNPVRRGTSIRLLTSVPFARCRFSHPFDLSGEKHPSDLWVQSKPMGQIVWIAIEFHLQHPRMRITLGDYPIPSTLLALSRTVPIVITAERSASLLEMRWFNGFMTAKNEKEQTTSGNNQHAANPN